jgi:hypothetical protein
MVDTLLPRHSLHFTQLRFTPLHYTFRHFTTLSFNLTSFKFPTTPFHTAHITTPHLTSLHFTSLHCTFRWFLPHLNVTVLRNRPEGLEGGRDIALSFHDLGARRRWVVNTTPCPLYARERPSTHCTGCWVGPRAGLDVCEKSRLHQDSIPWPSSS